MKSSYTYYSYHIILNELQTMMQRRQPFVVRMVSRSGPVTDVCMTRTSMGPLKAVGMQHI